MFTAAKYRDMADNCRRIARDLDAKSKADLEALAREYEDQASGVDRGERLDMLLKTG
jgi:hypothetical protein